MFQGYCHVHEDFSDAVLKEFVEFRHRNVQLSDLCMRRRGVVQILTQVLCLLHPRVDYNTIDSLSLCARNTLLVVKLTITIGLTVKLVVCTLLPLHASLYLAELRLTSQ